MKSGPLAEGLRSAPRCDEGLKEPVRESVNMAETELERYVGLYQSMEGHEMKISVQDNYLKLDIDQNTVVIKPLEKDTFQTPDGKKIVFMTNDSDKVVGVFSGLRYTPKIS